MFNKSLFGLDISDYSIEALQTRGGRIFRSARIVLKEGIVEDGNILDKEKLIEKIKEVVSKAKIKTKRVVLALPESRVFIHSFPEKEKIKEEAVKTVPFNPEEIYFDILNDLYVCAPKNIIESYEEVLKKSGLSPIVFDIEPLSLGRAFKAKDCLIIDIGARTTNFSIFDSNGRMKISASINKAGNHFTQAVSEKLKVSLVKAEQIKKQYGLDGAKKSGKIMLILQKELQPIIKETQRIMDFYNKEIKQILLVGGSALTPKITDYFSSNLDLKVKIGKPALFNQSILFNTVIGSALRSVKKGINLLPREDKKTNKRKKIYKGSSFLFVLLGLLFLIGIFYQYIYKADFHLPDLKLYSVFSNKNQEEDEEIIEQTVTVVIGETPTGWLRVREGPAIDYPEIAKVYSGESFPLLEEIENWYKIELEGRINGWISAKYANKIIN